MDLVTQELIVGQHPVLFLRGEIDLATIPRLHTAVMRFIDAQTAATVVLDLDGVVACDDAGLGSLLGAAGRARENGGDLVIVCSAGPLRARLTRTGFDRAVTVIPSIAAIGTGAPPD
jgi:anti-sigma B factor antagonist